MERGGIDLSSWRVRAICRCMNRDSFHPTLIVPDFAGKSWKGIGLAISKWKDQGSKFGFLDEGAVSFFEKLAAAMQYCSLPRPYQAKGIPRERTMGFFRESRSFERERVRIAGFEELGFGTIAEILRRELEILQSIDFSELEKMDEVYFQVHFRAPLQKQLDDICRDAQAEISKIDLDQCKL